MTIKRRIIKIALKFVLKCGKIDNSLTLLKSSSGLRQPRWFANRFLGSRGRRCLAHVVRKSGLQTNEVRRNRNQL